MVHHKSGEAWDNAWALCVAYVALAYLVSPVVVNGDGIGYLKATFGDGHYPGHLLLLPLFSLVGVIVDPKAPIDLLIPLRFVCHISGGIAIGAMAMAVRRYGTRAQLMAAVGLGGSFSVLISCSDLESYAPSLAALCCCLWALVDDRPVLGALFAAIATLLHVENILLAAPLFLMPQRHGARFKAVITMGFLVGGAYWIAIHKLGLSWLGEVNHGFRYPLGLRVPVAALHGIAKAFVYAPYPYEADWAHVVAQTALGVIVLGAVLIRRVTFDAREKRLAIAWIVPYAIVGVLYFPSDHERWIFILPILWWHVASSPRRVFDVVLIVALWLANAALWMPIARDYAPRRRAARVGAFLHPGDVIISPGHGWDELVGLYEGVHVDAIPLVYYAGLTDLPSELVRRTAHAPRILLVRLDGTDDDPRGWKELLPLGYTPSKVASLLPGWRFPLAAGVELYVPLPSGDHP